MVRLDQLVVVLSGGSGIASKGFDYSVGLVVWTELDWVWVEEGGFQGYQEMKSVGTDRGLVNAVGWFGLEGKSFS